MDTSGNKIIIPRAAYRLAFAALLMDQATIRGGLRDALNLRNVAREVEIAYWTEKDLQNRAAVADFEAAAVAE